MVEACKLLSREVELLEAPGKKAMAASVSQVRHDESLRQRTYGMRECFALRTLDNIFKVSWQARRSCAFQDHLPGEKA